jgi:hypothetical protein
VVVVVLSVDVAAVSVASLLPVLLSLAVVPVTGVSVVVVEVAELAGSFCWLVERILY